MTEPKTYELFRAAVRSANHLELHDTYTPDDPDWLQWRSGQRFNPAERWVDWFDLMTATTARGVAVRRLRIVSEPVTDYVEFEYDVTGAHNIAAGEQVRWLPRHNAARLLLPPTDFWVFDTTTVVLNQWDGYGNWVGEDRCDDPSLAALYDLAFQAAWDIAVPHQDYRLPR